MSNYVINPPIEENTDSRFHFGAADDATSTQLDVNAKKVTVGVPTWAVGLVAVGLWWKISKKK